MNGFSLTFKRFTRFIRPGDDFFEDGDRLCFSEAKHYIQDDDIDQLSNLVSTVTLTRTNSNETLISCDVKGCKETFNTTKAYDVHIQNSHRFSCRDCRLNFPSNFLLDVHITENHDSFFSTKRERGEALLVCLVESCSSRFKLEEERLRHLVEVHKYPSNFRFNRSRKKQCRSRKGKINDKATGKPTDAMELDESGSYCEEKCNDVTEECKNVQNNRNRKTRGGLKLQGIPKTINFGRGSSKAFQRSRACGANRN